MKSNAHKYSKRIIYYLVACDRNVRLKTKSNESNLMFLKPQKSISLVTGSKYFSSRFKHNLGFKLSEVKTEIKETLK